VAVLAVASLLIPGLAACGPTPEPEVVTQVVKETVMVAGTPEVVERVVTQVVTEQETTVVEVEKVVTATPEPVRKVVTIAWTQEPDSLNPYYTNMWYSAVLQQLYNCWAWQYDDTNSAYPHLVTEIPSVANGGLSQDGLVMTMHLRDDIAWSDGTPLTAEDFVFTYDMIMDPNNAVDSQYPYDYLESIEAPDAQTVVMTFAEPFASWQSTFWTGILPKHVLEPVFEAEGSIDEAEWNLAPTVGCGPFDFAEWESGSFIRFARNENYWLGESNLDEVFFQFVPDDASQTAACVAGDVDLGFWPPLDQVPILQAAGLELVTQASGYNEGWFFNFRDMASPAVKDVRVRKAIALALDRQAIAEDLLLGLTVPNVTFFDALPAFVAPDIEAYTYDPDAAGQLLEDAGWTDRDGDGIREDADGNKLTLTQGNTTRQIRQDVQAVVQQQLLDVGIDLQTFAYDADLLFDSYADGGPAAVGDLDIMEWSDCPYFPDPDVDYWLCDQMPDEENPWGYNYFGCDETLDELFQRQLVTVNAEERAEIFYDITRHMHEQVYYLGMWEDPDIWIIAQRLIGTKFSGVTPFYNIMDWDVTE
jgi:peptide/nickel transport system substrate-binding protein